MAKKIRQERATTIDATLCDAATIRDGLLNILGGGVGRVFRDKYPAPLGAQLALLIHCPATQSGKPQKLTLTLDHESGAKTAEITVNFAVNSTAPAAPGEAITVPLVASLQQQSLPSEGIYELQIRIQDKLVRTLNFYAGINQPSALRS